MQVKHILYEKGREVVTITGDATLSEAARLMARRRIGAVVVRGQDGAFAGVLSERDIVCAIAVVKSRIEETVREAESLREYIVAR
jgi:CBS domain-containing protein